MLFLIIILLVVIVFFVWRSIYMLKEPFIEQTTTYQLDTNAYVLTNTFKDKCMFATIKPTDVFMTNIIHYFHNVVDFVGICKSNRVYYILSKTTNIKYVSDLPSNLTIGYVHEGDKLLFERVFSRAYNKQMTFEKITNKDYVSDYCNSFDNTNNILIDFMESDKTYFVLSFNSFFDTKLHEYYKEFFSNRLFALEFTNTKIPYYIFNSKVEKDRLLLDEIIYKNKTDQVDYEKLINNDYIDFKLTQQYLDLYNCDVPSEIMDHLPDTNEVMIMKSEDLANTKDSCHEDTLIKSTSNPKYNTHGIHVYKSKHCKAPKNNFVDIIFPFSSDYEMVMSSSDFNELKINSRSFDEIVPINNAFVKSFLPRYKINVNPEKYPSDAYIDGIYYGSYGDSEYTILTNSIPFDLDAMKHDIIFEDNEVTISFKEDPIASYSYNGVTKSVDLLVGDRVYINPETIYDSEVYNFLNAQLRGNINLFHGYVELEENKMIIILENIRETNKDGFKNIQLKCYNDNLEETTSNCDNERACKYNHECPFFKSNSNYKNSFGGCQMNGFCQMPIGVTKRSFKKYIIDEESKPLCNNCAIDDSDKECCENASSPDYMFEGDTQERIKHLFMMKDGSSNCELYINKYY